MKNAPRILTAIPKRRYRIGEFNAVVLGDIESKDGKNYIYVFALVREGKNDPCLYVVLERMHGGDHHMLVMAEDERKQFEASNELADIELFGKAAIDAAARVFKLDDEEPYRMM